MFVGWQKSHGDEFCDICKRWFEEGDNMFVRQFPTLHICTACFSMDADYYELLAREHQERDDRKYEDWSREDD